ncbi:MAG: hypothetical protein EAX86_01475 [Candidatus Heimdallarchaeota archaeon]|nr:hypothetical protein [Candidatus Heimdallarchaeota archaeon]
MNTQTFNLEEYISEKRKQFASKRNLPVEEVFNTLEKESPLFSISRQIHLSEAIEYISGVKVPVVLQRYRGFLLNLETALIYFCLFTNYFNYLENENAEMEVNRGYIANQQIFEVINRERFPWNLVRPAITPPPLESDQVSNIRRFLDVQKNIAIKIAKKVEKIEYSSPSFYEDLFTPEEIKKLGITGPITRIQGILPKNQTTSTINPPASRFLKFSYTTENNMTTLFRIAYAELILALNQASVLLGEFKPIYDAGFSIPPKIGECTSTFTNILGNCHLTIQISNDNIKYFNIVPQQVSNYSGMKELLSRGLNNRFLLLFYDPELRISAVE